MVSAVFYIQKSGRNSPIFVAVFYSPFFAYLSMAPVAPEVTLLA